MRSTIQFLSLFWRGLLMGCADLVPGVSGGTIALLTGIYDPLIESLAKIDRYFWKDLLLLRWKKGFQGFSWRFLFPIILGIVTAFLSFTHFIVWLLHDPFYKEVLFSCFLGLVAASIVICMGSLYKYNTISIVYLLFGFILAYSITALQGYHFTPTSSPQFWVFFSGILAASAMLLPGISGSSILMILGVYPFAISAIRDFISGHWQVELFSLLLPLGIGVLIGLWIASRSLYTLLYYYHDQVLATLAGFIVGAIKEVWPFQQVTTTVTGFTKKVILFPNIQEIKTWLCLSVFLFFLGIVLISERLQAKKREKYPSKRQAVQKKV